MVVVLFGVQAPIKEEISTLPKKGRHEKSSGDKTRKGKIQRFLPKCSHPIRQKNWWKFKVDETCKRTGRLWKENVLHPSFLGNWWFETSYNVGDFVPARRTKSKRMIGSSADLNVSWSIYYQVGQKSVGPLGNSVGRRMYLAGAVELPQTMGIYVFYRSKKWSCVTRPSKYFSPATARHRDRMYGDYVQPIFKADDAAPKT